MVFRQNSHEVSPFFPPRTTLECHEIGVGGGHMEKFSCRRSGRGEGVENFRVTAKDVAPQAPCRWIGPKGKIGGTVPNVCQG